ncbi:MAG: ABC transporter permease [Candidatus Acidiferrum sp.]
MMRPNHWIYTLPLRLRSLFRRNKVEQDLNEELQYHLEQKTQEYTASGLPLEEARRKARRDFGGLEQSKENCRDARRLNWLFDAGCDLKFGLRILRRSPGFAVFAVLILALGIGGNATIFSLVEGILLSRPPYPHPEQVVMLWEKRVREHALINPVSPADYLDWKRQNQVFDSMAEIDYASANLLGGPEPLRLFSARVGAEFFKVLGVQPALGRLFEEAEEQPGRERVVVLSNGFWQAYFARDPRIIGRAMNINGETATVIGVLPANFVFPYHQVELWMPLPLAGDFPYVRSSHFLSVLARLKAGFSIQQAQTEMDTIAARIEARNPNTNRGHGVNVLPLREELVRDIRPALKVLSIAVGFVLLIACANVANLFLARGIRRQRELAVRQAVGATRWRLVRQMLVEGLIVSAFGGIAGCTLASWGISGLSPLLRQGGWDAPLPSFTLNPAVLAFLALVSLGSSLLIALVPALASSKANVISTLKGEGTLSRLLGGGHRLRGMLLAGEVALSALLLIGASLLLNTYFQLRATAPGFHANNVLALPLLLNGTRYQDAQKRVAFFEELMARAASTSGVASSGGIDIIPMSGDDSRTGISIENRPSTPDQPTRAHHRVVTPGYFETMEIPLLAGRTIRESDTSTSPPIAVINEAAAKEYWPDQDALGKRVKVGGENSWREIVGVVANVKDFGLSEAVAPAMYLPLPQSPTAWMNVVMKTKRDPSDIATALKTEVYSLDKDQPVGSLVTLSKLIDNSIASQKLNLFLLSLFAGAALILAGAGVYCVLAFTITQRTHEIGIRIAIGARQNQVLRLIVGQGMLLVVAGLGAGILAALALTRLMRSLLFGVSATDPLTFAGVVALLSLVGLVACYLPARRATRVDPLLALRHD